jgi:hypothetical protein
MQKEELIKDIETLNKLYSKTREEVFDLEFYTELSSFLEEEEKKKVVEALEILKNKVVNYYRDLLVDKELDLEELEEAKKTRNLAVETIKEFLEEKNYIKKVKK